LESDYRNDSYDRGGKLKGLNLSIQSEDGMIIDQKLLTQTCANLGLEEVAQYVPVARVISWATTRMA
jgi:hypothetical protein